MWAIDASATATANPGIMPRKILEMRINIILSDFIHTPTDANITRLFGARIINLDAVKGIPAQVATLQHKASNCRLFPQMLPEISGDHGEFMAEILALCDALTLAIRKVALPFVRLNKGVAKFENSIFCDSIKQRGITLSTEARPINRAAPMRTKV
jgi:hypothetical protein